MVEDAAWGIGYGAVDIASTISGEQHQSSHSGMLSPQSDRMDDLSSALSACSVASASSSSGGGNRSPSRGRKLTSQVHSQSRSPSSSPQTPIDEDVDFFSRRRSRTSSVRFVLDDDDHSQSWPDETRGRSDKSTPVPVTHEDACTSTNHSKDSGLLEPRSRSQSRTRSWSFNI